MGRGGGGGGGGDHCIRSNVCGIGPRYLPMKDEPISPCRHSLLACGGLEEDFEIIRKGMASAVSPNPPNWTN